MRKASFSIILITFICAVMTGSGRADMDLGISIGDDGLKSFYLAVGDYYRVPEKEVMVVKKKRVPHEEIPVVFFIAKRAHISVGAVIDLRLKGTPWMDISLRFGLTPDIYYVPVKKVGGPPYGKAYGHYKNKPRKQWKSIVLGDADVVNLVNLKFISEHYGYAPEEIISMRSKGKNFVLINSDVKKRKAKKTGKGVSVKKASSGSKGKSGKKK
jgi:hypothetical protein